MKYIFVLYTLLSSISIHSQNQFDSLKIMSWNVFLRPGILKDNQLNRVHEIAHAISAQDCDIVLLQEVFHRKSREILIQQLVDKYPYYTKIGKRSLFKASSGLLTFSKFKFNNEKAVYFKGLKGSDQLSFKGAISVCIKPKGQNINIINTHFQAGSGSKKDSIRMKSAKKMRELYSQEVQVNLISGDFNIEFNSNAFKNLQKILNISKNNPTLTSEIKHTANFSDQDLFPCNGNPVRIDHHLLEENKNWQLKDLKIFEPKIKNKRLSDHNPIQTYLVHNLN